MPRPSTATKVAYMKLTRTQLVTRLARRTRLNGAPVFTNNQINAIVSRIDEKRKALRKAAHDRKGLHIAWGTVITPLKNEMRSISVRLAAMRKKVRDEMSPSFAREQAKLNVYEPYYRVLQKVLRLLRTYQQVCMNTPQDEYQYRHGDAKVRPDIPYGQAWCDWVPDDVRKAILVEHNRLQAYAKTRPMRPLFRRDEDIKRGFMQQHDEVKQAWRDEAYRLEDAIEYSTTPRPLEEVTLSLIRLALHRVRNKPPTARLSPSWRKYLTANDVEWAYRDARPDWKARETNQPLIPATGEGTVLEDM